MASIRKPTGKMNRRVESKKMLKLDIVPFEQGMFDECVKLLAEAFAENPLHRRAFGDDVLMRNYGFFTIGLRSFQGHRYVALVDNKVVGFMHWVHSDRCQFSALEKFVSMPAMIKSLGVASSIKVGKWLNCWEQCDLPIDHLHLGPIAVHASMRGLGIGAALMEQFCYVADKLDLNGYLETDKPENVVFYERFNFTTLHEEKVLGVKNFFMARARL